MIRAIKIADKLISADQPPFIIAEMSGNHNQSLDRALEIVEAAANAGAHAVKLQTYTADTMTLDCDLPDFQISDPESLWHGKSLYQLYEEAHTPWEWHGPIFQRCKELGVICFSTPFDHTAVDFLEEFNPPCYKIASFENTDTGLLQKVANTGKPMIISTGMASLSEMEMMVNTITAAGCEQYILLKCTSAYPASPADANIKTIPHMADLFDCPIGLSDHTMGIGVAVASVALGATVIEKHFTLSREAGGVDASFSMQPEEMRALVDETYCAWQSLGKVQYRCSSSEVASKQYRRSVYAIEDIEAGALLTRDNIKVIRPGFGLAPRYYQQVLGQHSKFSITRGTALNFEMLQ